VDIKYQKAMNEVMQVIGYLNDEDKNKIPPKIINFFKENSLEYLLDEIEMTPEKIKNDLSLTTRKFLKMIAIYLK